MKQENGIVWLTPNHIMALSVLIIVIGVLAFFVGLFAGRKGIEQAIVQKEPTFIPVENEEDALEDLLARLEAASLSKTTTSSSILREETLSFPEVLKGEPGKIFENKENLTITKVSAHKDAPKTPMISEGGKVPKGGWAIQVASLDTQSLAEEKLIELQEQGYSDAYWIAVMVNGKTMYRVRIGGFAKKELAVVMLEQVEKEYAGAFVNTAP